MIRYQTYCSEKQALKALELDAPLDNTGLNKPEYDSQIMAPNGNVYNLPTIEEVMNWLRVEKHVHVAIDSIYNASGKNVYHGVIRICESQLTVISNTSENYDEVLNECIDRALACVERDEAYKKVKEGRND